MQCRSYSGMAVQERQVNLSYEELEALCGEREALLNSLQEQVYALKLERDQALRGLELLTEASRRRGCCDAEEASP